MTPRGRAAENGGHSMENGIGYEKLLAAADQLYRFVMTVGDDLGAAHDYGTGKILNVVEMHTLALIAEQPGICVTEVASLWNRTRGAASRNVNRLASKGYVVKRKLPGDDKRIHLYPTQAGCRLAELHRRYDRERQTATLTRLLACHTPEELEIFFRVLQTLQAEYDRAAPEREK